MWKNCASHYCWFSSSSSAVVHKLRGVCPGDHDRHFIWTRASTDFRFEGQVSESER